MKNNIKSAVGLTSYFFTLPSAYVFLLGILVVGLLFGLLINISKHAGADLVRSAVIDGLLVLSLPALLSSAVVWLMIRRMPLRRIVAVAFLGQVVYGTAYALSLFIVGMNALLSELILLIGAALVFILWYTIARLVFILKYRSILFAIIQLLFYLVFLVNSHLFAMGSEPLDSIAKFYAASFILFGALYLFFLIINAPMKKSFGFSSTDAISLFVSQWLYKNKDLEKAFEAVGARAKTIITVLGFERKNGNVYFLTPLVHFGPFGNLGGSDFSYLLAEAVDKKLNSKSFVFHGTVTHDFNPVASSQLDNVVAAALGCIRGASAEKCSVSFVRGSHEECFAETLYFNDTASFTGLSRAPYVTEDITFGLGMTLMKEAEKRTAVAMVVDQHNAETGEITSFESGDQVGYTYLRAVEDAVSKKARENSLKVGVSFRTIESGFLGRAGIKVAMISSEPQYAMILIDSNGVTPKFREQIIRHVKSVWGNAGKGMEVGVFTTDTHATNVVRGVLNPLKAEDRILQEISAGVKEAMEDMQEARFFAANKWFDITVLGAKQSIEIISTVNSIVAVAKITLPLIMFGAILVLFALLVRG